VSADEVRGAAMRTTRSTISSVVGRGRRALALAGCLAFVAAGVGAGTGTGGAIAGASPKSPSTSGATVTYALLTGQDFSWIFPLLSQAGNEVWNWDVIEGSWLPLYAVGYSSHTGIDYPQSIGQPPVYSDDDTTVTIHMNRDFTWSDGTKVTSADVKFFFELEDAGKHTLGNYVPGLLPDDITSVSYPNAYTFVLHLNHSYNPTWFTGNQLTWIYPLPAQAWDKTCATCAAGDTAATPSGAKAVFDFLMGQSKTLTTYATNPLWKTVDGPWMISSYDSVTYSTSLVANPKYTGPTRPRLAGYKIVPFTTATAELDSLRSGDITFGFLPIADVSDASYFKDHGYRVLSWKLFYNEAIEFGYTSKTWGPLVKQLYIRQALQHLVTENLYISKALHGYGIADYGVVSAFPGSSYVSSALRTDPYPYSVSAATKLLTSHGWVKGSNGVDVCKRAGTGRHDCGAGIAKGRTLSLPFLYENGTTAFSTEVLAFDTATKQAGFDISLEGETYNSLASIAGVCPSTPPCKYGMAGYSGFMWNYGQYQNVPSGEDQFGKGNYWAGGYYTAKAQSLIDAAISKAGFSALYADEKYLSKDVASLWWPLEDEIVVVKKTLKGWALSPYGTILPLRWYKSR
jgi:peptide/nickel transport system substrate-binding protein